MSISEKGLNYVKRDLIIRLSDFFKSVLKQLPGARVNLPGAQVIVDTVLLILFGRLRKGPFSKCWETESTVVNRVRQTATISHRAYSQKQAGVLRGRLIRASKICFIIQRIHVYI